MLLAETEFKHEVEVTIEPFKGLLMGLFFMSVGLGIDLRQIAQAPLWLPLSLLGLFAIKSLVLAVLLKIGGFQWGRALEGGLLLGQGGEFAFIVVGYAMTTKLIAPALGQFVMLLVGLSLFATPLAAKAGRLFGDWWEAHHRQPVGDLGNNLPEPTAGLVIIAGFGRVGQLLGQILDAQGIRFIALENNARLVAELHPQGVPVYFGDAARPELLRKVHADQAAAIVLTMDHPASALHAVKGIRREYPQLPVFARSRDENHARMLKKAGATIVIPETLESGLQLSAVVLQTLGIAEGAATLVIQNERDRRISALQEDSAD